MKAGDLIKCKAGYFEIEANPLGIIIEEIERVHFDDELSTRQFVVIFENEACLMYEYEMDVINAD